MIVRYRTMTATSQPAPDCRARMRRPGPAADYTCKAECGLLAKEGGQRLERLQVRLDVLSRMDHGDGPDVAAVVVRRQNPLVHHPEPPKAEAVLVGGHELAVRAQRPVGEGDDAARPDAVDLRLEAVLANDRPVPLD